MIRSRAFRLLFLAAAVALAACGGPRAWRAEVVLRAGEKLGGCAVGDLDPAAPGLELAAVSQSGKVYVVARDGEGWLATVAAELPGEMIQCAIGDADASRPGVELVAVGMADGGEESGGPGAAHVVYHDGHWRTEPIAGDAALLHGVAIGDGEAFVVGFTDSVWRARHSDGAWRSEHIAALPGPGKSAACDAGRVLVACADGSLVAVAPAAAGWSVRTLDHRDAGRARLACAGTAVLTADDDGVLTLVGDGGSEELWRERAKLRGAVLADLEPERDGLEAATAGYEHRVTILRRNAAGWQGETIYTAADRLHHLATGDIDGDGTLELLTCGYDGSLVLLRRE